MLVQIPELQQGNKKPRATLLYSARTLEELAFKSQLELLCKGSSGEQSSCMVSCLLCFSDSMISQMPALETQ
jgi:hypothetical protein